MKIHKEYLIYVLIGITTAVIATFPIFIHPMAISNHGDMNRALIYNAIARTSILSGQLPLWNQYICGGAPLWGDLESWFLQPLFLLTLPFHEIIALKITYTLTLVIVFLGFALFARRILRFQLLSSILFSIIATYSGYISQHLAEGYYVWIASAYIPWTLLFAEQAKSSRKYIPLTGLMLAFMFGAGSMHLVVFSLFYSGMIYAMQISRNTWKAICKTYIFIVFFFLLFAAIKLLPAFALLGVDASREGFVPSVSLLSSMLFARGLVAPIIHEGILYRFAEFGNYIGIITAVLAAYAAMILRRRAWSQYKNYLIASALFLCIAFLPLPITHGFISHVTDLFRMPSRVMIFPIIGIALLASITLEKLAQGKRMWVEILLVGIVACDLISNDYQLFTRTFTLPLPEIHQEKRFMRVSSAYTTADETYYRTIYVDYLENRGTNDVCRFYQNSPAPHPIDSSDPRMKDFGEAYLANSDAGVASIQKRSSVGMDIEVDITKPTLLIINQNYYPGWKTVEHIAVINHAGLVAIPVNSSTKIIHLMYQPTVVYWGALISIIALIVGILYVV